MVEDDASTATAMRGLFTKRGWDVTVVGKLADAERQLSWDPHWIILDLMLPEGNGERLLERVRQAGRSARVVVTTGVFSQERLRAVHELRPEAVMVKPINVRDLLNTIQ